MIVSTLLLCVLSFGNINMPPSGEVPPTYIAQFNFPFILNIKLNDKIICVGTLYMDDVVLTPASCFRGKGHGLFSVWGKQNYPIDKIVVHEQFAQDGLNFNIALIKLKIPLEESPIVLDPGRIGLTLVDYGFMFGRTNGKFAYHAVPMFGYILCQDKVSTEPYYEFCVGFPKYNQHILNYIRGSPILVSHQNRTYLAGFFSRKRVTKKGVVDAPAVALRVSSFKQWIESTIESMFTASFL
ncbi:Trypsin-2 [Entomophthora muscae]|uniref:Trypsin-2 n=1 Tax=Entomophthora muscae TaxID=34485 RepID=A0ACC2UNB4_9FUNG|nr:Trypsin-2 [Entomophthora muscae]